MVKAVAPTEVEYVPAGQDEQAAAPSRGDLGPNVPAGHPRQSAELVLPVLAVYVPTVQGLHTARFASEYEPLRQLGHVVRETAENVPAAQTVHVPEPALDEIDPNGHGLHCEEPNVEKSPAGQAVHDAGDVAPIAADADPAAQGKHVALDEAPRLSE